MTPINNYTGYCLAKFVRNTDLPEGISEVIGKPRGSWHLEDGPLVIYRSVQELIEATPGFNKKTHPICEVIVHIVGERVEIVSQP